MSEAIRFYYRGSEHAVSDASPNRTLLQYLREDLHACGTKEGCAEGDCGACTVVLAQLDNGELQTHAVNACIQLLPSVHGKAVFSVEDVAPPRCAGQERQLHPVQQALLECHGSQCGFCTPGFVMSLWALYLTHQAAQTRPTRAQICDALSGNLCRCTGYKPIIEAAVRMFELPAAEFPHQQWLATLQQLQQKLHASVAPDTCPSYSAQGQVFYWPQTLQQALQVRASTPQATILAGGTDVGLWVTKQLRDLNTLLYIGQIAQLQQIQTVDAMLEIGAAVNLNEAYHALCQHYPRELTEMWQRFASMPVRNAGTLGGNVANGSPIGDSMPWLIALGAQVRLQSVRGSRQLALEDFYLGYQQKDLQADELLTHILVPLPRPNWHWRTYKLAKRFDQDISAVCAAFALEIADGSILNARITFGGMAATPKRAMAAECALQGQAWDETTLNAACLALASDYAPLSDMRASQDYRRNTAQNLLRRFWLETRPHAPLTQEQINVFAQPHSGEIA
ncbi:MAG: xanthine dehydrogenase small subunit [Burkholderiales bacterium]|nr:xanthine dehydrogenase small subunit [Burkholderiales bacterium]